MKKKAPPTAGQNIMQEVYYRTRFPALALALVLSLDIDQAYDSSKNAHILEGSRHGPKTDLNSVLRRVLKATPSLDEKENAVHPALEPLAHLDREARAAWALKDVCGFQPGEISSLMKKPPETVGAALQRAGKKLSEGDAGRVKALVGELLQKKELWSGITFGISRRKSAGRRAVLAFGVLVLAAALLLTFREALALARIFSLRRQAPEGVLTDRYAGDTFYKRFPERAARESPRVSQYLWDQLAVVEDGQAIRVAFRFYDRDAMLETEADGQNLEDLYTALHAESLGRGRVNALTANALNAYYAAYQRPFKVTERRSDFQSSYDSVYHAALDVARGSDFEQTIREHPEIFGSRDDFEQYLYGREFLAEAPYLYELLDLETQLSGDPQLREAYEEALFAFFNPGGRAGKVSVAAFPFEAERLRQFFVLRERLGKSLYPLNVQRCAEALPEGAALRSDDLEGSESSLFSATLTKADLLKLAQEDGRFQFLGVAPPETAFFDGRIEADLALSAREEPLQKFEVYQINEEFYLYSLNYAAPLTLPQGFIDGIRAKLDCEDTGFEMEVQYVYQMRYAHPQTRTGYGILRALIQNGGIRFTSQQYKAFSKMAAY